MRRRAATTIAVGTLALACGAAVAVAQPIAPQDVPPELRPWVPWVLDELSAVGCPRVQEAAVCVWPGRLQLDLASGGGSFVLDVKADQASTLRLPGSAEVWPQDLRLDGSPVPAFEHEAAPRLRLARGSHRVSGRFVWSRLPESLNVPPEVGLVDLRLDGRSVARPRREKGGLVWLRARGGTSEDGDSLRLQVFRRIADGIPLFVETRVQLEVAGRARELTLEAALLPGSVPVAVRGDLPARVEDGSLRVQVRPGRYGVAVDARLAGQPEAIERPDTARGPEWQRQEVWVFAANERLRQVELAGPPPVDTSRTELPQEWRSLPAFLVEPGARLLLTELRRGQPAPPPDALTLSRELWLDPDGSYASVRDRFAGTLRGTTRLDLLPPGALGRVSLDGQDQLVTANPETDAPGVELRREALQLEADSRLALGGALPAVGWTSGVEQLGATLHVPPGWTLLAASGVDQLPGTWTARWTLLGFFFVLIITLAVLRLFGRGPALVALAALVFLHGEPDAPFLVWLSLVGAVALRRVAPEGRLASLARIWFLVSAAVLVILIVPFARDQVRGALYPQVSEPGAHQRGLLPSAAAPRATSVPLPGSQVQQAAESPAPREQDVDEEERPSKAWSEATRDSSNAALEQDPKAVIQTGPGVPRWTWRSYSLQWTGPVGRDHTMRLLLASPDWNRLFTLVRLVLLALLTLLFVGGRLPRLPRRLGALPGAAAIALATILAAGLPARAQEQPAAPRAPSRALLDDLKARLARPAACDPNCVSTPALSLELSADALRVVAEVHASADGAWPVPGPLGSWAPSELRADGAAALAAAHLADGFLRVRLSPGVHRIEARGPLPPGDSVTLQFAAPRPRRARAQAPGWDVSGLRVDGPPEPSILLTRRLTAQVGGSVGEGRYSPWLEVTRTLGFGLAWTVRTRVRRLTPLGAPVVVRVPLLPGEAPTRADLVVSQGQAAVSLAGDQAETEWDSTLAQDPKLTLTAPQGVAWSEVWRLECSAVWPCEASGLPPVARVADGIFTPEYRPWPGERLEVLIRHPKGVEGRTLTLDDVALLASPGSRLERARLTISARSSREQPLVLRLPAEAEVQTVTVDRQDRPSRPEGGELRLTVPAGDHQIDVRWQQPRGLGIAYALPRVALSAPAVDVTQTLELPPNRWLLFARGPAWGPAILFWSYLVFLLALALLLGRLPWSPLTSGQWVLLGLGLSQLPALGALAVAAFVFALALRARRQPSRAVAFDAVQTLLAVWSLVSLALLYVAIHQGLLFRPDMQVAGSGSSDTMLRWYVDRVEAALPGAGVLSLPMWVYRIAMLAWSLWLAASLVRAAGWGWRAFGRGGYWRPLLRLRPPAEPSSTAGPSH